MRHTRSYLRLQPLLAAGLLGAVMLDQSSIAQAQCGGTWTQRSPLNAPSPRLALSMAYDAARGVSVLYGGAANGVLFDETWVWDGANWTLLNPATSPGKRFEHAMAYDSTRAVIVLFGGRLSGQFGNAETFEWDGSNWFLKTPAHSPPARFSAAMAFDSARNKVVLFGGYDSNDLLLGDTWEWDGADWLLRSPAIAPAPRAYHAMAYDAARGVTVLFGGYVNGSNNLSDETWEWNGTDWSLQHPSLVPTARASHALAYDAARGVAVFFGGTVGSGNVANDTREWDGAKWIEPDPAIAPSARSSFAMAHDANRHTTVLFGGSPTGALSNETWEWIGPTPAITQQPADQVVTLGNVALFTVEASGPDPLNLRWHKDGAPLADGGAIAGATSATLTISPTALSDAGTYECLVSNPCGNTLTRAAQLNVEDPCIAADASNDCNGNGVLDSCDIAADSSRDCNGNGALDSCEMTTDASLDCNGNGALDSCEIAADASLDANANGSLDACESPPGNLDDGGSGPCGLCGGGMSAMMPLLLAALCKSRRIFPMRRLRLRS